jgi:hypothetical protein
VTGAATTEVLDLSGDGGTRVLSGAAAGALATGPGPAGPGTPARPMPPLRGAPDGERPGGPPPDQEPASRRRWVWLIAGLVLLVAAGAVAWLLLGDSRGDPGSIRQGGTTASSTASASSTLVRIDTSAFIGEDADAVQRRLEAEGLKVTQQDATAQQLRALGRALDANAVVGSDPANKAVAPGTPVVLFVSPTAYNPGGGAATTTAAPTTHARPTRTTAHTTSAAPTTTTATTPPATTSPPATTTPSTAPGTELSSSSSTATTSSAQAAGPSDGAGPGLGTGSP